MSEVRVYPVTDDPDIARQIIEKMDEAAEHFEVEAFAHSLGLFPPWWREGDQTTIGLCWHPGQIPSTTNAFPCGASTVYPNKASEHRPQLRGVPGGKLVPGGS